MTTTGQEATETFAYLDHNILDMMTKGDPKQIKELLKNAKLIPIFSNESLKEIHRSKGYEHTFLDLLEEIEARFIEPTLDQDSKSTGQAQIYTVCPKLMYEQFLQNEHENQKNKLEFSDVLLKFYGGKTDLSFTEVFENQIDSVQKNLLAAIDGIKDIPKEMKPFIDMFQTVVEELPVEWKEKTAEMTNKLDNMDDSPITSFEAHTGVGAATLKNINPPHVVQQVWSFISDKIGSDAFELETFFGIKPQPYDPEPDRERTLQEKVNAIYQQLNFLGYYRDSNMKVERRFKASFSDMTHAGVAAFCHVFICRDGDLVMKTKAAYEYLGINTVVLFYPSEKQKGSVMLSQLKKFRNLNQKSEE